MLIQQIDAKAAFIKLRDEKNAVLIDVRTDAEFAFTGTAEVANLILLPWKTFPTMGFNPRFTENLEKALQEKFGDNKKDAELIFMCRSGARSSEAAIHMAQMGYTHCFNLIAGFEGDIDSAGHRGNINGWKASNLAWRQS